MGALVFARRPGGLAPAEPGSGGNSGLAKAGPGKAGDKAAMAVEGAPEAAAAAAAGGPYSDLYQLEELWAGLARDFVRTCCALLGQVRHGAARAGSGLGLGELSRWLACTT